MGNCVYEEVWLVVGKVYKELSVVDRVKIVKELKV